MEDNSICSRDECQEIFIKAVHNQKYCSPECCRLATNQRLMEQYHEKKSIRNGNQRVCSKKDCDTILSKYNKENICESCKIKRFMRRLERWGWDVESMDW